MASAIPARNGCVFWSAGRVAGTQNRRSKYLNFADVQDSIHNDKPTGILLFTARSAQGYNSASRVHRSARARTRRTRRHPRTSGDRRSVRRDCRRRAGSARVDGRAASAYTGLLSRKRDFRLLRWRFPRVPSHRPIKLPARIPPGTSRRGALDACSGLSAMVKCALCHGAESDTIRKIEITAMNNANLCKSCDAQIHKRTSPGLEAPAGVPVLPAQGAQARVRVLRAR